MLYQFSVHSTMCLRSDLRIIWNCMSQFMYITQTTDVCFLFNGTFQLICWNWAPHGPNNRPNSKLALLFCLQANGYISTFLALGNKDVCAFRYIWWESNFSDNFLKISIKAYTNHIVYCMRKFEFDISFPRLSSVAN